MPKQVAEMEGWIPVGQRLPEAIGVYVLVSGIDRRTYRRRELHVAAIDDDDGNQEYSWMTEAGTVIHEVTHWMPLPPAPAVSPQEEE